jgi:DNA polymerase III sliding clamp (beta) subunit (PCNA family)
MKTMTNSDGDTVWRFSKAELVVLLAHMSRDEASPAIYGLSLDSAQGRAFTSDGHRLIIAETRDRVDADRAKNTLAIVPRPLVEKAVKVARHKDEITIVIASNGRTILQVSGGGVFEGRAPDESPPPVDQIMATVSGKEQGVSAHFNAAYLADVDLVARACPKNEGWHPPVQMCPPEDERSPALFRVDGGVNLTKWTVAIMPMRH